MTFLTRRLIFYGLLLIFLIITPIVILYARGYVFDFEKSQFVKTGVLILKSAPKQADVFVNGKLFGQTPITIKHLLPKTYAVKISKNGYSQWEKQLEIKAGLLTEAQSVILLQSNPDMVTIAENIKEESKIEDFLPIDQNKIAAQKTINQKLQNNAGWQISSASIFYIKKENFLMYQSNFDGTAEKQITFNPLPSTNLNYKIILNDNGDMAVISPEKNLLLFKRDKTDFEKIADNITDALFSPDAKKIIYYSPNEIWVIYLDEVATQPYKIAGEKELITRYGEKINSVAWHPDSEAIFIAVNEKIKLAELDGRQNRNFTDFIAIDAKQIKTIENKLYFMDKDSVKSIIVKNNSLF